MENTSLEPTKKPLRGFWLNALSKAVLIISLGIVAILAIPACVLALPAVLVWALADSLLGGIEKIK